jgi:hypothetical protein
MMDEKRLVDVVESCINDLVKTFLASPYWFYTENDLHCYLYNLIHKELASLSYYKCETLDGKRSIILHKEYPTKERYSQKHLEINPKGKRGHFDLCIWNPELVSQRLFRARLTKAIRKEQQTYVAIEFNLVEANASLNQAIHHIRWDLLKLRKQTNEVKHGYALLFVREWIHKDEFLRKLQKAQEQPEAVVLYIENSKDYQTVNTLFQKSFLDYKPL